MGVRLVLWAPADELKAERRCRSRNLLRIDDLVTLNLPLSQHLVLSGTRADDLRGLMMMVLL